MVSTFHTLEVKGPDFDDKYINTLHFCDSPDTAKRWECQCLGEHRIDKPLITITIMFREY